MNPTQTAQKPSVVSPENLLEKAFENDNLSSLPPIDEENLVTHSEEHRKSISSDWVEFMSKTSEGPVSKSEVQQTVIESRIERTEVSEGPASRVEVQQTVIEQVFKPHAVESNQNVFDTKSIHVIEDQKGSGSAWAESGIKLLPDYKDIGKSLFGALNIFKEIFVDTFKVMQTGFKVEKAVDPEKAKKEEEKKAEKRRKAGNISAFFAAIQSQISPVNVDVVRMDTQEKENINKTVKLNVSYKGIKDNFGRLTVYAASMFEREQLDEERKMKKMEKEQRMASVTEGPDLNMDKVAEGGFLSSTGGQGAG